MARVRQIRVLIADDNRPFRRGIRLVLEKVPDIRVIGEAGSGSDAVTVARAERADVVLMDLQMPDGNGLAATRALAGPGVLDPVAVVVMTGHNADRLVLEALDCGASGYLLKGHDSAAVLDAIRAAHRGEGMLSSRVTVPVLREMARRRGDASTQDASVMLLTPAETRVVTQLVQGCTRYEDIAGALHLSVETVRAQMKSALRKTGAADRTQLALWGVRRGFDRVP